MENKGFQSVFKINGVPIMPPVITQKLRKEILQIRALVRAKELNIQMRKEAKNLENKAKQSANDSVKDEIDNTGMGDRSGSYILLSPVFGSNILPNADSESTDKENPLENPEENVDVIYQLQPLQSEASKCEIDKSSKDLKNEIDKRASTPASVYSSVYEPQVSNQLRQLIDKQKMEYLKAMEVLKQKFTEEQQQLLTDLETSIAPITSTPLNNNSIITITTDDDEDFTDFKTCLQSQSQSIEEKTIVNDYDAKFKASIIINASVRGYLTRRLMATNYVQEHIRNIKETLHLVLDLHHDMNGSPMQNILLKAKLFRQLQGDLYKFSDIFFKCSTKEQMKIIATDRDAKFKKMIEANLSLSFTGLVSL